MQQEVVLAMLAKEPSHGYQLRARLRGALGPLGDSMNAGQVYVTLTRLESALARALGATPRQVSAALSAAQVLPALAGATLGVFPGGFALFAAINGITGGDSHRATLPSPPQVLALILATVLVVAALTALPARLASRRPVARTL